MDFDNLLAMLGLHPWLQFLAFIVGGALLAFVANLLLLPLIARLALKTKSDIDDRLIAIVHWPLTMAILLFATYQGLVQSFPEYETLHHYCHHLLSTLAVLIWMIAGLRAAQVVLEYLAKGAKETNLVQKRTLPLFQIVTKTVIVIGAVYCLILVWEQNVTGWFASAGIAGIALGFAAKDTLANLFAGISIIADAPYKLGDFIVLEDGDRGRVTDIGIRSTRLITLDNVEIVIPNAIIGNSRIVNLSGGPAVHSRLRIPIGVAYGSDLEKVRSTLEEVADGEPLVLNEPQRRVRVKAFGDSSVDFELLVWVALPELREPTVDRLLTEVYKAFGQHGIEIPYPKRDVYLHQVNES